MRVEDSLYESQTFSHMPTLAEETPVRAPMKPAQDKIENGWPPGDVELADG
jgi:hypothetical protein